MEIRRPQSEDIKELHRFFREVITDTFRKEGIEDQVNDMEEEIKTKKTNLENDFESNGQHRFFLIAVEANKIIGTIEYGQVSKLILKCTNNTFQYLKEVGTVFVSPGYQKKGIGNLLLQEMYRTLQYIGVEEFCLDSGYRCAQAIWRGKFGEPDYVMKDYWGDGFHHMIWKLNVNNLLAD
ncbi:GNAT family N-acetyltransferase [Bacillus haikouensis]|uniref:GNAT family N-acetyltransferase n=1 Tax=Bacillus haikouensis TaxID=1510468 RepID=UPI001556A0CD|nr:GNAT family N-acetyltransferase [Bacillus haikouensis]NQD64460.1 GNAT family N-acetyltransferase [Bacillus haikouensis]